MSRRGLPTGISMRHDAHYVEELSSQSLSPIGRMISVDSLDPNPEQPRVEIGDLSELMASVREKGVLEPLLVKPSKAKGHWMIIAGERRWRAARAAGLREVPCIEMEVDECSVAEIALIENMQRKDLTSWEEADGLAALCQRYGYTHEDLAKKVGKSRSTITEALSLAAIPEEIREECRSADIHAKSLLLQIIRQPDVASMREVMHEMACRNIKREEARAPGRVRKGGVSTGLPRKPCRFKYALPEADVEVEVCFQNSVEKAEVVKVLRLLLVKLEEE